jgi:hypothetical protein
MDKPLPEPWLRGALTGVDPFIAPTLCSFQQAREDVAKFTEGLTTAQIWERPFGMNAAGREIRHIGGSVDRLTSYLEGKDLTADQLAALKTEADPGATRDALLRELEGNLARSEQVLRNLRREELTEPRAVGRQKLPTTVIGLVVHISEHTQRHVGQAISAAKLVRAIAPK